MSVFRVGSNKSSVNNFPSVRPTLDLDFANSKTLDPRITFTRASGGSYVGADGLIKLAGVNEARFDHDPVTGESLGLLIEEARTNLLLRSEEFDDASWGKQNSHPFTANSVVAPDGTLTADTLYRTAINQFIFQSVTGTGTYTLSAWVRSQNATGSFVMQPFNLTDGNPGVQTFTATNVWKRFSITTTITANSAWYPCIPVNINENFYVWGAQLEVGSFPTSYIPTVASTRTRAADNASITGKNFSEWYRQDEGTIYSNINVYDANVNTAGYKILQGASLRGLGVQYAPSGTSFVARTVASGFYAVSGPPKSKKVAGRYKIGYSVGVSIDGSGPVTSFSTSEPVFGTESQMDIGGTRSLTGSNNKFNGAINRITYYNRYLPLSQLQALTS